MCGFVGFLSNTEKYDNKSVLFSMLDTIIHRGPDSSGVWVKDSVAFGHRRLSIHDLSPLGHQPMNSYTGRYTIAFNGEIYNYQEIKDDLIDSGVIFNGKSDTEVLINSIEYFGLDKTLNKIKGMFAFSLYDSVEKKLFLVRDRMGEKPLYYYDHNNELVFGSQLNAVAKHPSVDLEFDFSAISQYLKYGFVPAPKTVYQNIYKLRPGQYLEVSILPEQLSKSIHTYWSIENRKEEKLPLITDPSLAMKELDRLINESVSLQSKADVPVGSFLSGGVDSSLISAYLQSQSDLPIDTFTIGFEDKNFNEAEYAEKVANHIGSNHTQHYISSKDLLDNVPQMPKVYDEPFADSSQIPTYIVGALAKKKVTVALSGDGGDELFCGYSRYFKTVSRWNKINKIPRPLRKGFAQISRNQNVVNSCSGTTFLGRSMKDVTRLIDYLGCITFEDFYDRSISTMLNLEGLLTQSIDTTFVNKTIPHQSSLFYKMMDMDINQYLQDDILVKVDRAFMASSLEGRIPLLDKDIVEFSRSVPSSMHVHDGKGKYLLRHLLFDKVPRKLIERPKKGFGIPLATWLREDLFEWANDLLTLDRLEKDGIFRAEIVRNMWNQHTEGVADWSNLLWSILMFNAWLDEQ